MANEMDRKVIRSWVAQLTDSRVALKSYARANVMASEGTIYSYGHHFPMGVTLRDDRGELLAVLLNGNTYSVTTTSHQFELRNALNYAGINSIIVPFDALHAAGIDRMTIRPVDVKPDAVVHSPVSSEEAPATMLPVSECRYGYGNDGSRTVFGDDLSGYVGVMPSHQQLVKRDAAGRYTWHVVTHWLGDAVFSANVNVRVNDGQDDNGYHMFRTVSVPACFVSSFDRQESRDLYFLSMLPREVSTLEEALEALKPEAVTMAEDMGRTVTRQGDMFAIPMGVTTRQLKANGATFEKRARTARVEPQQWGPDRTIVTVTGRPLMGTAHTATEVATLPDGSQFARGSLYHVPAIIGERWRDQDHARRRMGDGKSWHLIARNTVPTSADLATMARKASPSTAVA